MDKLAEIIEKNLIKINNMIISSAESGDIDQSVSHLYNLIKEKYNDIEFFKIFDQIINLLSTPRVIKDKDYTENILKKYLILYYKMLDCDYFDEIAILFNKIIRNKRISSYPIIYKNIFQLISDDNNIDEQLINEHTNLSLIIGKYLPVIKDITEYSSSYTLYFNSKIRNELILFLYDFYSKNKELTIWFPFSGISVEPQIFSYLFHLVADLKKKKTSIKNFNIYVSDHTGKLLERGLRSNFFEHIFQKMKDDFCKINQIPPVEIKTSLTKAKKAITYENLDLIYKNEVLNKEINFVVINSLKLSDLTFEKDKMFKLLNKIHRTLNKSIVIIELISQFPIKETELNNDKIDKVKLICNDFYSKENIDYHIQYFAFYFKPISENTIEVNISINDLFENYKNMDIEMIKKSLNLIDTDLNISSNEEIFKYSEILAKAGFHSKSFSLIKKIYKSDYNKTYGLLNYIYSSTKNEKLKKSVDSFIITNRLRENAFSEELFFAIEEEIDVFLNDNDSKWL